MLELLTFSILILILLEVVVTLLFFWLKKDFQWLISKNDEDPIFNKSKFDKFLKNSFDKYLGWDRKANSRGFELSNRKTTFKINHIGSRGKKVYKKDRISVFGDSFAFCRYVNDHETWQLIYQKNIETMF